MKVINFYGGPGTGKSTAATGLFSFMKQRGANCEYVSEFAKDAAWEVRSRKFFSCQQFIWGEQSWRLARLRDEVDYIITDSPLLLNLIYTPEDYPIQSLKSAVVEDYLTYDNLNIFLTRTKEFNPKGRNQTKDEAVSLDGVLLDLLENMGVPYQVMQHNDDMFNTIWRLVHENQNYPLQ